MPLSEHERQVMLFNLHVGMVPEDAPRVPMAQVLDLLQDAVAADEAYMLVGEHVSDEEDEDEEKDREPTGPKNIVSIAEMAADEDGTVTLLLHHGDVGAADPALMKILKRTVRNAGKAADEGVAHAAHLVISTRKHLSPSGQCRALLERVPNLGRSTVIGFLNRLIRVRAKALPMTYKDPKTGRKKKCHPKFVSQSQMSHRLKSDLKGGKLSRIEFVTRRVVGGFEEKNRVVPMSHTIVHKVINAPTGKAAFDLLERAKAWAKGHDFEEMQIRFRKPDTEQSVSPRFATDLADAEDAVYSRFEVLPRFEQSLEQCPKNIVPEIKEGMEGLFGVRELWK